MMNVNFNHSMRCVECWVCGCIFGVAEVLYLRAKNKGSSANFFCPNGHSLTFGEGAVTRLEKELEMVTLERTRCRLGWEKVARENGQLLKRLEKRKKK